MPPLDRMRKIRRDIIRSINDYRDKENTPGLYQDILANRAANDYAEFLLNNDEDPQQLKDILAKHMFIGEVKTLVGFSYLEDDDSEERQLYDEFMDAHGLLLELQDEREELVKQNYTHIGIGFEWNKE